VAYSIPSLAIMLLAQENGVRVDDWGQLSTRRPASAWAALLFLLSLVGIPPLVGFFGKFYLFATAIRGGLLAGVVVAVIMSVVSAGYYLRIVRAAFYGQPAESSAAPDCSVSANVALTALAVAVIAMGLAAGPLVEWAGTLTP
ncbi:MAG: hypothetical protein HY876_02835, partial [Coriobacteriales bacterium]|nr:hypothetical protein [Coriobacteriales bacterium]